MSHMTTPCMTSDSRCVFVDMTMKINPFYKLSITVITMIRINFKVLIFLPHDAMHMPSCGVRLQSCARLCILLK